MMRATPSVAALALAFLVLAVVLGTLERLWPAVPDVSVFRRRRLPDVAYWFFTPLITKAATRFTLIVVFVLVARAFGGGLSPQQFAASLRERSPLRQLPLAAQLAVALLVSDFFSYWSHRLFHRAGFFWRIHAIHHSARDLDWLAATRLHPLNDMIAKVLTLTPVVLLGARPEVAGLAVPVLSLWAVFLHANVPWGFGPLRYVIATPLFHRWHHTSQAEGLDKNFAGFFPVWDALFGTLYLPRGRQPLVFGVADDERVPEGLLGQLWYPFKRGGKKFPRL